MDLKKHFLVSDFVVPINVVKYYNVGSTKNAFITNAFVAPNFLQIIKKI